MRYFRDISILMSIIFLEYLDTDSMRYTAWYRCDTWRKYITQGWVYQHAWRMCSYGSISKPDAQASLYKLTAESAILCLVGCIDTSSTQVDARKRTSGKCWTYDMQFLAISTKARTAVGKAEECLPCDSPVTSYKRERVWPGIGHNIRVDGTENTTNSQHDILPALFGVCIDRSGAVLV